MKNKNKIKHENDIDEKSVSYSICVNKSFDMNLVIDTKKLSNEKIILLLKEKGILNENANKENINITKKDSILIVKDSEMDLYLFELRKNEIDKKEKGGSVNESKLLNKEYFKKIAPVQNEVDTSDLVNTTVEQSVIIDGKEVFGIDTGVNAELKTEPNPSGNFILPDYDNSNNQESILRKHLVGNEIHESHFEQILQRKAKYEEVVGTLKLRKCFLKPYYKII